MLQYKVGKNFVEFSLPDVKKSNIDIVASSAHKGLMGPHGIGYFYCSNDIISDIRPLMVARTNYIINETWY